MQPKAERELRFMPLTEFTRHERANGTKQVQYVAVLVEAERFRPQRLLLSFTDTDCVVTAVHVSHGDRRTQVLRAPCCADTFVGYSDIARRAFASVVPTMQRGDHVSVTIDNPPVGLNAIVIGDNGSVHED